MIQGGCGDNEKLKAIEQKRMRCKSRILDIEKTPDQGRRSEPAPTRTKERAIARKQDSMTWR